MYCIWISVFSLVTIQLVKKQFTTDDLLFPSLKHNIYIYTRRLFNLVFGLACLRETITTFRKQNK